MRGAKKKEHPVDSTHFPKKLKWLEIYLRRAKDKMPSLEMPRYIRSFKPSNTKIMRNLGNTYFETKTISLATHDQQLQKNDDETYSVYRIIKLNRRRILETFAHELAHLHYQTHGFEQKEFAKIIFKAFAFKEPCPHCEGTGKVIASYEG